MNQKKRILALDIGVSSVGLALIHEVNGKKTLEKLAVRIVPEDPDFHGKFYSGNTASKNMERTQKRGIRRNNQRFKARRDQLNCLLKENQMYPDEALINLPTRNLYGLRSKAVTEKISLQELGRILMLLNQRRGFLSNRKSISKEENTTEYKERIFALEKERGNETIGQQLHTELQESEHSFEVVLRKRTYLRASYLEEFDRIWEEQKKYHSVLTGGYGEDKNKGTLYDQLRNRIMYYQRPLRSKKGLVSDCRFEKHHKAVTKSSPYFQLYQILQKVNDLSWTTPDGEKHYPTHEQREQLKKRLWSGKLNSKYKLTVTQIKSVLGFGRNDRVYLNFTELDGAKTYSILKKALQKAQIENPEQYLFFKWDHRNKAGNFCNEKGGLFELWHITYSLPHEQEVINTLVKRFGFTVSQSRIIAQNVGYSSDYGSLSTRAIRKLLPHLEEGLQYSEACDEVEYDHSGYKTAIQLQPKLEPIKRNALRNPVVEQILNQVVNMVNMVLENYGAIHEIRVELARALRNSAKTRKKITKANSRNKTNNARIRKELQEKYGLKYVNGRDIKRFILWEETDRNCLYCNHPISGEDFSSGKAEIEHILPKSRSFNNTMSNYILAHTTCNSEKGQMTAYDFMASKGEEKLYQYTSKVNEFYADGKGEISKAKFENLMCKGEDIPDDFVERMKKDSQYIATESVKMLRSICPKVNTTTGQVTDLLRDEWGLKHLLQEFSLEKYQAIGQTEEKIIKTQNGQTKTVTVIKDWSKRNDHRHHAVDALICALTDQEIIFRLNNRNKLYQYTRDMLSPKEIAAFEEAIEGKFSLKTFLKHQENTIPCSMPDVRHQAKKHLEEIFVSYKKENSKVLTKNSNVPKNGEKQMTWVPRGRLHEDTVMGEIKRIASKKVKLDSRFPLEALEWIVNPEIKELLKKHLSEYHNNPKLAFSKKTLKSNPIYYKNVPLEAIAVYEKVLTKRVKVDENMTHAQINKIIDLESQRAVKERLAQHDGNIKAAFKNLGDNPIYLKTGMVLKSVTVSEHGKVEKVRNGYAKLGNNHHALIYKDAMQNYHNKVVTFWVAVAIGLTNVNEHGKPYPIINRSNDAELGEFQFSMQKNDLFVFDLVHSKNPEKENELNFFDDANRKRISEKLFRLQKMSKNEKGQFVVNFRHHLETSTKRSDLKLKNITWITISKNSDLKRLTKIRLNHLGEIIKIGE